MIKSLLLSFIISTITGKYIIDILKKRRIKQIQRQEGPETHLSKAGTPTMGGIFVIITFIIVGLLALITGLGDISNKAYFMHILFASFMCGMVGFLDDFLKVEKKNTDGLSPKKKLGTIAIIAFIFAIISIFVFKKDTIINIPFLKNINLNKILYIPFSILVLLATTNTLNLTDGIDGLASTVGTIIMTFLLVIALKVENIEVAMMLVIAIGGFLGFLLYNWNKAKVFMGDTGSFFLGGIIGIAAMALNIPVYLFFVAIIPVVEAVSVILQVVYFKKTKKRLFLMAPIHHHFEKKGWSEVKVVFVFSAITIIGAIISYIGYIV